MEKQNTNMKNVQTFDQFVNESYNVDEKSSGDNALLQKMYKALKNSKSFKSIKMEKPYAPEDWDGSVIKIVSKLKGTSQYHKDEVDEFEIGIEKDGGLTLHYVPSGNTEPVKSVVDVVKMTRANESVNEAKNWKGGDSVAHTSYGSDTKEMYDAAAKALGCTVDDLSQFSSEDDKDKEFDAAKNAFDKGSNKEVKLDDAGMNGPFLYANKKAGICKYEEQGFEAYIYNWEKARF